MNTQVTIDDLRHELHVLRNAGNLLHSMLLRPYLYGRSMIANAWEDAHAALTNVAERAVLDTMLRTGEQLGLESFDAIALARINDPQAVFPLDETPEAYRGMHRLLADAELAALALDQIDRASRGSARVSDETQITRAAAQSGQDAAEGSEAAQERNDGTCSNLAWGLRDVIDMDLGMVIAGAAGPFSSSMLFFGTYHMSMERFSAEMDNLPGTRTACESTCGIKLPEPYALTIARHRPALMYGEVGADHASLTLTTYRNYVAEAQELLSELADHDGRTGLPLEDYRHAWQNLCTARAAFVDETGFLTVDKLCNGLRAQAGRSDTRARHSGLDDTADDEGKVTLIGNGECLEIWADNAPLSASGGALELLGMC